MKKLFTLLLFTTIAPIAFAQEKPATKQLGEPFENIDASWQNGNDRRDSSVFKAMKYFTPSILVDVNYTYSGNNPNDNTVIGSTALSRNNEVQLSALHLGGDLSYNNAHARIMTQLGTRSIVVPRNDFSSYRGQYDMMNAYRYVSEANVGYHFNKWYGINLDAGTFLSFMGMCSYYQAENWVYQASFSTDNTPWYFNGLRLQVFPKRTMKIEGWLVNGWQSYGRYNKMPGLGLSFTYMPNSNFKVATNNYFGTEAAGIPKRQRYHSDNVIQYRYFNRPDATGVSRMACSFNGDIGFEQGGGVNGFTDDANKGPAQYFASVMCYNRIWFNQNKLAWTFGGGYMTNPGRYLLLYPSGQASPLPNPNNPTTTEGAYPFSANPGDKFEGFDCSTNLDYMPNQSITFRVEYVHRQSSVPYFAGSGGVTSPSGYTTTTLPEDWRPDLVTSENRIIMAILFRL